MVGLAAIMAALFIGNAAAASANSVSEGDVNDLQTDGFHFGQLTPAELRRFYQLSVLRLLATDCDDWSDQDSRVGLLLPVEGAAVLFVGKGYDLKDGGTTERVRDVERGYLVESFAKGGTPLEGQVSIKLQPNVVVEERSCLERLQDVPIRWAAVDNGTFRDTETVELTVSEVRFFQFATLDTDGNRIPTGETLATLKLSEGWFSMAYRKARENIWGIAGGAAGSACLMLLSLTLRILIRHLRRVRRGGQSEPG